MDQETAIIHLLCRGEASCQELNITTDEYCIEFENKGLTATSIPVLQFEFSNLTDLATLLINLPPPEDSSIHNGLVITSPRVVESLKQAIQLVDEEEKVNIIQKFDRDLVFVVGAKSGTECRKKLGLDYNISSSSCGNSRKLADFIRTHVKNHIVGKTMVNLIYPKSSRSNQLVENILKETDCIQLKSITTYDTISVDDLNSRCLERLRRIVIPDYKSKLIVNMIFFSPSGLESYLRIDRDDFRDKIRHIFPGVTLEIAHSSIGKTTEIALLKNQLEVFCVSDEPNPTSLVKSIMRNISINETKQKL